MEKFDLGKALEDYRKRHRLSQRKMGNLLNMSRQAYQRLEKGFRNPSLFEAQTIAAELGIVFPASLSAYWIESPDPSKLDNDKEGCLVTAKGVANPDTDYLSSSTGQTYAEGSLDTDEVPSKLRKFLRTKRIRWISIPFIAYLIVSLPPELVGFREAVNDPNFEANYPYKTVALGTVLLTLIFWWFWPPEPAIWKKRMKKNIENA